MADGARAAHMLHNGSNSPPPAKARFGMVKCTSVLSKRLRYRLKQMERPASWLARQCQVHTATANGWVSGRHTPPLWRIRKIADVLKVSVAWLLGELPLDGVPEPF
jgi:hypothetical protein